MIGAVTTITRPETGLGDLDMLFDAADLWAVVLWNDDVSTFATVIRALVEIFAHSEERASALAWRVHSTGRATVAVRPRGEAEAAVRSLHARKLQATLDRA